MFKDLVHILSYIFSALVWFMIRSPRGICMDSFSGGASMGRANAMAPLVFFFCFYFYFFIYTNLGKLWHEICTWQWLSVLCSFEVEGSSQSESYFRISVDLILPFFTFSLAKMLSVRFELSLYRLKSQQN